MGKWQDFEKHVRTIASAKWSTVALAEEIAGVKCDCVLKPQSTHWVFIEITQTATLTKRRDDFGKFNILKSYALAQGIFAEFYMIVEDLEPNSSMRKTGHSLGYHVLSQHDFINMFWNYESYCFQRKQRVFGSATVDGKQDTNAYIKVQYKAVRTGEKYTLERIKKALLRGGKILLLGDYGTGKSRCIQELFMEIIADASDNYQYALAINLRENWGLKTGNEILNRHFDDLGLDDQVSMVKRIIRTSSISLLLDGFDEISSQVWSDNPFQIKQLRQQALAGVRALIGMTQGGVIITGRAHYCNSTAEILECLGLSGKDVLILECENEFSQEEAETYIKSLKGAASIPSWLPKKPLIVQLFATLPQDVLSALLTSASEVQMCRLFIGKICQREANIDASLEKDSIQKILVKLARLTRLKPEDVGPLSVEEINNAFTEVIGAPPVSDSAIILQRLPGLARYNAESSDRKFIDYFLLDPLRAEDVLETLVFESENVLREPWRNPLKELGVKVLAEELPTYRQFAMKLLQAGSSSRNKIIQGDLLSGMLSVDTEIDMHNIIIENSTIELLDFAEKKVSNLTLKSCCINAVSLWKSQVSDVILDDCIIMELFGISNTPSSIKWFRGCVVEKFYQLDTLNRIRKSNLSLPQQLLVSTLRKMFFQPGSGRKEESILKGFGQQADRKIAEKIIKLLVRKGLIDKTKGQEGNLYIPNREYTYRAKMIMDSLSLCDDEIWQEVTQMDKRNN